MDLLDYTPKGKRRCLRFSYSADIQVASPAPRRLNLVPSNLLYPLSAQFAVRPGLLNRKPQAISEWLLLERLGSEMGRIARIIPS